MTGLTRRFGQIAAFLLLASAAVFITQWAYPAGHLAIRLGHPEYSRTVGESDIYVSIDIRLENVGTDPITVDREHFLLVDNQGQIYRSDPSTHFLRNHFDITAIAPGRDVRGATVFRIAPNRTAAQLIFVTTTGQIVRLRLF